MFLPRGGNQRFAAAAQCTSIPQRAMEELPETRRRICSQRAMPVAEEIVAS